MAGSYQVETFTGDRGRELERLRVQARLTWAAESRALLHLGVGGARTVLEIGCGPGFVTEQLLELLPASRITCLDVDAGHLAEAERRLGPVEGSRLSFVQGLAADTGLPDGGFDAVVARLLFQHLPDPAAVVREAHRLLRPSGRLFVIDVDDDLLWILDPPLPGLAEAVGVIERLQEARGGNRRVGRRLPRLLREGGFDAVELQVAATHSEEVGLHAFAPQLDPDVLANLTSAGLSAEAAASFRAARDPFFASPESLVVMCLFVCAGVRR